MNGETPDLQVRRWLTASGGALCLLALIVLFGRFAGFPILVTLVPNGAPMAFATVMGFLATGVALTAYGRGSLRLGRSFAIALVVFGLGTIVLYTLAEPLQLKAFIYDPNYPVFSRGIRFDGRMSPNAAFSFALLGTCILLLAAKHLRPRAVAPLIALLLAISLLAIISYVTGLRFAVAWWRYTAMAIHTALAVFVAALALLVWLLRRVALAERAVTRTMPFFVVAGTAVLVLAAVVMVSNEQRQDAARLENHALQVEAAIDRFIASVARLESSTRAYAVTGDEPYLERIRVHRASVENAVATLVQLTAGNPAQNTRARALEPLVAQKFAVNDAQVRARQEGGPEAAAQVLRAEAPELMAGLREATSGLQVEERRLLLRRRTDTEINESRLRWVLLAGACLTIGLVASAFGLVNRAQRELEGANLDLDRRVRARTTELQQSTEQLSASESRLRFLANTMPQLVWTARPDGTIESLNQGYIDYLGKNAEAEAIEALKTVVHPDDQAMTGVEWTGMIREHRAAGGELRLLRADGEYRWHLWRAHPERDRDGQVVRWVGTSTDIHDKKLAEAVLEHRVAERTAELATSEERFRQSFYFAGTGMAIVGLDGRFIRVNKALCDIVGYSETDLLQRTFQDITHPDDLNQDLAYLRELVAGERRVYQMEKRYIHRKGRTVWIRLTVSLVRDLSEAPVHFVSQIEDITERKTLEVSLAAARDQALEASRLKSEFLATMSHEIRTPMNGVIGMTALLRDTPLTETQAEYIRTIESSGESLLTIINDILDYSKIEAGRIELEVAPFDLRHCIEDALDLFATRALEKKIELMYLMGAGVPAHVAGDATRLRQILVNLLGNAIKFTDAGEVIVTVDAEPLPANPAETSSHGTSRRDRCRLRFAVKDTGIGISPEGMSRLFKSFSQVDASTTRKYGGTGLGLAISKRLAELMGGEMHAESTAGEGSTFHFSVLVDAQPQLIQHPPPGPQPELQGRRLLIVDDNATNRQIVASYAQAWGMSVQEAATPQGALAILANDSRWDIAVLDMHMPGMDGEQLATAIHAVPGCAAIPLVLLTSLGRRTRSVEFAQSLSKPVKHEALFAALRASVRPETAATSSRPTAAPAPADVTLGRRHPLRLLVAEDNAVNQKVASLLLQRLGYRCTIVANGLEAVSAMGVADYDTILMDVEMPELDGIEATRRLRTQRGSATRPWIIALTAGAMQGDRERALNAGMNDFLTKPVRADALSEALVRAHKNLHDGA